MLSRNQLFRKVSGIAELMDAAHREWRTVRESIMAEVSMTPHVRRELQNEKKILLRLANLRKSLREIRDNALFDSHMRVSDGERQRSIGPVAHTLVVGDRLLSLIKEDPGFKPLKTPKKVANGIHVGSIHRIKVVHNVRSTTEKRHKKRVA